MTTSITIVSESNLSRRLLSDVLSKFFYQVDTYPDTDTFLARNDWSGTIVVWEVGDPAECATTLNDLKSRGQDLDRFVLILQASDQIGHFTHLAGLMGAILPPTVSAEEIGRLSAVVDGGICVWPRSFAENVLSSSHGAEEGQAGYMSGLTRRERTVLSYLSKGHTNKCIADSLEISESTVRVHVRSVLKKLGVRNRTQAALRGAGRSSALAQ